jgi:hypothetical protein
MRTRKRYFVRPAEANDPSGALAAMHFPVEEIATSLQDIEQDHLSNIDDGNMKVAASVTETEAEHSQETDKGWRIENHLLLPEEVDWHCANDPTSSGSGVVSGLIARRSVSFLIGDSGLGKSPLAYQLGLCVAAGIPFLGMKTLQGTVVYADYENALEEGQGMRNRLLRFLGLSECPKNFLIWTPDQEDEHSIDLEGACEGKPLLLILDSVRSHNPQFERTENAGDQMKQLNNLAHKYGVAMLAIHHLKKPSEINVPPSLDNERTSLMLWLKQTAGHSSIINQSHTRIATDIPDGRKNLDAVLILRWHRRVAGEFGPLYLERVSDDESGDAIGYRQLTDVKLLGNQDQQDAFRKLPEQFSFKEARQSYGRSDDPTRKWLQRCISLGLVRQVVRGRYARTDAAQEPMEVSSGPQDR